MLSPNIVESFTIFAGTDETSNKRLIVKDVSLWSPEEKSEDHNAGGALGGLHIGGLGLMAPEISFAVVGTDRHTLAMFGLGSRAQQHFTIKGVLRDKNGGKPTALKVSVLGRIMKIERAKLERGHLGSQDHKIGEITHYEEYHDQQEVYYYDYLSSIWRVNGIDSYADENAILNG